MSHGPFPPGTFLPGSYEAQQQRLYENLPKQLKDAYRKDAIGQCLMSSDEKNAYKHLAEIFGQIEMTNTYIEVTMDSRSGKKKDVCLKVLRAQLAGEVKEWEDSAKEPLKVFGSVLELFKDRVLGRAFERHRNGNSNRDRAAITADLLFPPSRSDAAVSDSDSSTDGFDIQVGPGGLISIVTTRAVRSRSPSPHRPHQS